MIKIDKTIFDDPDEFDMNCYEKEIGMLDDEELEELEELRKG